jgi:hypothetical protein
LTQSFPGKTYKLRPGIKHRTANLAREAVTFPAFSLTAVVVV